MNERGGIGDHARVDVDAVGTTLQGQQVGRREQGFQVNRRAGYPLHDDQLFVVRRVVHEHLEHEPVELGFGQEIGTVGLDRVLGGQHQEWLGNGERLLADGHLVLLHDLEQRRLDLGGGAVDLVGEQEVGEDRPELGLELAGAASKDARANQVGRDQVGRELDPPEGAADDLGQSLHSGRLG